MIDKKIIDEINEKTDIVALVSEFVQLEKAGKNYRGVCPFHDDTNPSFIVSPEKNISKCFSCNEGGRPITFYQKIKNVSFRQATVELAERLGIKLEIEVASDYTKLKEHDALKEAQTMYRFNLTNTVSGEEALKYLQRRGLKKETVSHFNIGYSPVNDVIYELLIKKDFTKDIILNTGLVVEHKNKMIDTFKGRVMFPITDEHGNTVGFSGRSLGEQGPKYYNSPESVVFKKGEVLYHLYEALGEIRKAKKVILHEGFFDCIASYEAGIKNTVATMGTALTLDQAKLIKKHTNHVIIAFDGDKAGIEATYKAIEVFKQVKIRVDILKLADKLDPDDYIKKYGKEKYLTLFTTKLQDPYAFTYETNKASLNLKNANDVAILKNVVRDMIVGASSNIREHYIKRLSEDLNVTVYSLSNLLRHQKQIEEPEIKKTVVKTEKTLPNKFYIAERVLFINMLRDKETSKRIEHELGTYYVCDLNIVKLRMLLHFKYYQTYDFFDNQLFIAMVEEEQDNNILLETLNSVFTSAEYQDSFIYTEQDIEDNIKVLKTINQYKEYQTVYQEVKNETESYQKTILMEKQKEIKLKITNS